MRSSKPMAIPVIISTKALNRLIRQAYEEEIIPEVSGRVGRSDLLHACYVFHLDDIPYLATSDDGHMVVRVPVQGEVSIPWGLGLKVRVEAEAAVRMKMSEGRLNITLDDLVFDDLRLGHGCSLPPEVLKPLGSFVEGALNAVLLGEDGTLSFGVPEVRVPLTALGQKMIDLQPIHLTLQDVAVTREGIAAMLRAGEGHLVAPPLPSLGDLDLVTAVSEQDMDDVVSTVMGSRPVEVEGETKVDLPDQGEVINLFTASAETLISFGRRGLGRRVLRGSSRIKVKYSALAGTPKFRILERDRLEIVDIPAHLRMEADLEMDIPTSGWLTGIGAWFQRFSGSKETIKERKETRTVKKWTIDRDMTVEKVDIAMKIMDDGRLDWSISELKFDLEPESSFPKKAFNEVISSIGKHIAIASLPMELPKEIALPGNIPLVIRIDRVNVATSPGVFLIGANIQILPAAAPEEVRRNIEEKVQDHLPLRPL